jgi:hypothetical protein
VDGDPRPDRALEAADTAIRLGAPTPSQLSGQPWVGERAAALLPALEKRIRELCEPFTILTIFLGGSAVHGELCGVIDPAGREVFLSDLDLGVLTARRVLAPEMTRIAEEVRALAVDGPSARLGFYCREDLKRQHPTLGLVETVRVGFVLGGDASWLGRMGMPRPAMIPPWEGRRLLANRALEWLAARQERAASPVGFLYAAAKLHADAGAACLLAAGAYRGGGYRDRLPQIRDAGLDAKCRARVEAWSAWRLEPGWNSVPGGGDLLRAAASGSLEEDVAETVRAVIRAIAGSESAESFLDARRMPGRTWARSWKRWMRVGKPPFRAIAGPGLLRTPRLLLWEAAIECAMGREERAIEIVRLLRREALDLGNGPDREIVSMGALMEREGIE